MSNGRGLYVNEATIQALGVLGVVILPAMWLGYKIGQWRGNTSGKVAGKPQPKSEPKPLESKPLESRGSSK